MLNRKLKMKTKLIVSLSAVLLVSGWASGQVSSLGPVLIGSTGNFVLDAPANLSISSSCGEVVIPTFTTTSTTNTTRILTQGFQQPRTSSALVLNASVVYSNVSCLGANDGIASATATGGGGGYTYQWSNGDSTAAVDSLVPGTYTVTITDAGGLSVLQTVTINEGGELCGVHIYSGFTPNGDGANDAWVIDYIDLYPGASVHIFDRWGTEVWSGTDYDNTNVVWTGKNKQGNDLPDGTYFYVVTIGDKTEKDWVELTR